LAHAMNGPVVVVERDLPGRAGLRFLDLRGDGMSPPPDIIEALVSHAGAVDGVLFRARAADLVSGDTAFDVVFGRWSLRGWVVPAGEPFVFAAGSRALGDVGFLDEVVECSCLASEVRNWYLLGSGVVRSRHVAYNLGAHEAIALADPGCKVGGCVALRRLLDGERYAAENPGEGWCPRCPFALLSKIGPAKAAELGWLKAYPLLNLRVWAQADYPFVGSARRSP